MALPQRLASFSPDLPPLAASGGLRDLDRSPSIPPSNQLGSSDKWLGSPDFRTKKEPQTASKERTGTARTGHDQNVGAVTKRKKKRLSKAATRNQSGNGMDEDGSIHTGPRSALSKTYSTKLRTSWKRERSESQWIAAVVEGARAVIAADIEKAIAAGIEKGLAKSFEQMARNNASHPAVAGTQDNPAWLIADPGTPSAYRAPSALTPHETLQAASDGYTDCSSTKRKRHFSEDAVTRKPNGRFTKRRLDSKEGDGQAMPTSSNVTTPVTKAYAAKGVVSKVPPHDSGTRGADAAEPSDTPFSVYYSSTEYADPTIPPDSENPLGTSNIAKNLFLSPTSLATKSTKEHKRKKKLTSPLASDFAEEDESPRRTVKTRSCDRTSLTPKPTSTIATAEIEEFSRSAQTAGNKFSIRQRPSNHATANVNLAEANRDVTAKEETDTERFTVEKVTEDTPLGLQKGREVDRVENLLKVLGRVQDMNTPKPKVPNRHARKRRKVAVDDHQHADTVADNTELNWDRNNEGRQANPGTAEVEVDAKSASKTSNVEGKNAAIPAKDADSEAIEKKRKATERRAKRKAKKAAARSAISNAQNSDMKSVNGDGRLVATAATLLEAPNVGNSRRGKKGKRDQSSQEVLIGGLVAKDQASTSTTYNMDNQNSANPTQHKETGHGLVAKDLATTGTTKDMENQKAANSTQCKDTGHAVTIELSTAVADSGNQNDSDDITDDSDPNCYRDLDLPCGHKRRKNWSASLYQVDKEGHRNRIGNWEELWSWTTRSKFSSKHPTVYKLTPRSICPRCPGTSETGKISGRHYFGDRYYWMVTHFQPPLGSKIANIMKARSVST